MLEVWHEIKVELEQENIRPVSPDVDNMMEISRILNERAAGVSATQVCLREERDRGEYVSFTRFEIAQARVTKQRHVWL